MNKYVIEIECKNKLGETYISYPILIEDVVHKSFAIETTSYIENTPVFSSPQEAIGFWYNREYLNSIQYLNSIWSIQYDGVIRIRKINITPTDEFRPMPMIEKF